jgi:hypothetical protein
MWRRSSGKMLTGIKALSQKQLLREDVAKLTACAYRNTVFCDYDLKRIG